MRGCCADSGAERRAQYWWVCRERSGESVVSAVFHPVGILMLLGVQWYALVRQVVGRPVAWRTRAYASATGEEVVEARKG
jgi:hypothetical protein